GRHVQGGGVTEEAGTDTAVYPAGDGVAKAGGDHVRHGVVAFRVGVVDRARGLMQIGAEGLTDPGPDRFDADAFQGQQCVVCQTVQQGAGGVGVLLRQPGGLARELFVKADHVGDQRVQQATAFTLPQQPVLLVQPVDDHFPVPCACVQLDQALVQGGQVLAQGCEVV